MKSPLQEYRTCVGRYIENGEIFNQSVKNYFKQICKSEKVSKISEISDEVLMQISGFLFV